MLSIAPLHAGSNSAWRSRACAIELHKYGVFDIGSAGAFSGALITALGPLGIMGGREQIKIDGYRVAARIERGKVQMLTRHANDWTAKFRPIAAILATLQLKSACLDGEVAVLTPEGISDFGRSRKPSAGMADLANWPISRSTSCTWTATTFESFRQQRARSFQR